MDVYGGVSRGTEQWTVRASRELGADGDSSTVGPLHYDVLEPMRSVRFALDANDAQPVSFEWIFAAVVPPVLENHEVHRRATDDASTPTSRGTTRSAPPTVG